MQNKNIQSLPVSRRMMSFKNEPNEETNLPNGPIDPVVEILQQAYRRGLAIRRQQAERNKAADNGNLGRGTLSARQDSFSQEKQSNHRQSYLIAL